MDTGSASQERWTAVNRYIADLLIGEDPALDAALKDSVASGLPPIAVTPTQGKLLELLARVQGARTILELGTLGGYSTIWLARALPAGGRLVTLEANPRYAEVAQTNIARAGFDEVVELRVGPALETLPELAAEGAGPFDMIFIDADKRNYPGYFEWSLKLSRPGTLIVGDNVVRDGAILDPDADDPSGGNETIKGVRRFYEMLAAGGGGQSPPLQSKPWATRATTASRWCSSEVRERLSRFQIWLIVQVSMSSFHRLPGDPSGCHRDRPRCRLPGGHPASGRRARRHGLGAQRRRRHLGRACRGPSRCGQYARHLPAPGYAGTVVNNMAIDDVPVEGHEQFAIRGVSAGVFVVQQHAATTRHFDLRLEVAGVMRSWAVPKGPSLDPAVKRLAVQVDDHGMEHNAFEGPTNSGGVVVWDRGSYEQGGRVAWPEALDRGHAVFVLHGQKLRGGFALQRTQPGAKPQWLLLKRRDELARPGSDIVAEEPASVLSGQTLDELLRYRS